MGISYIESVKYYLANDTRFEKPINEFRAKCDLANERLSDPNKLRNIGIPFLDVIFSDYSREINFLGKYLGAGNSLTLSYYRSKYYQAFKTSQEYRKGFRWGFSTLQNYGGFVAGVCIEQGFSYENARKLYDAFVKHEALHAERLRISGLDKKYPEIWKHFENCFLLSLVYNLKLNRIEYLPEFYFKVDPKFENKLIYSKIDRQFKADLFYALLFQKTGKVKP